jgi:hypothetical protein
MGNGRLSSTLGSYMAPTHFLAPMAASETLEMTKGSKIISFIIKQTEQDQYKGWLPNSTMRNAGKGLQWGTESMADTVIVYHVLCTVRCITREKG